MDDQKRTRTKGQKNKLKRTSITTTIAKVHQNHLSVSHLVDALYLSFTTELQDNNIITQSEWLFLAYLYEQLELRGQGSDQ